MHRSPSFPDPTDAGWRAAPPPEEASLRLLALGALGLLTIATTLLAARAVAVNDPAAFVAASLVSGAIYAVAVAALLLVRTGRAAWPAVTIILLIAAVLRVIALIPPPNLSSDAYRYVWDGRVQAAGVNPYLYVPADPRLAHLRDAEVYPNINQKERAVTIYPPAAQMLFRAAHWAGDSVFAIRLVMLAFDAMTVLALLATLRTLALPAERIAIYAWHPLPIWEFAGHGHLDAAVVTAIALGILAAVRGRQSLVGVAFAVATLLKYFPVLLLAALWRRWDWRLPAAFVATAVLLYLPYVTEAGGKVIGFLATHLDNEGYGAGWGFHPVWLLRDFALADPPAWLYVSAATVLLTALAALALWRRRPEQIRFGMLLLIGTAFVFLTSPHYAWYFAFLVALLPFAPHPAGVAFTLLASVLYLPRPPGGVTWTEIYLVVYWLPLAIALGCAIRALRRRRRGGPPVSAPPPARP